jgi:DUF4097 and DUF4098 domain-containing protein YvlB
MLHGLALVLQLQSVAPAAPVPMTAAPIDTTVTVTASAQFRLEASAGRVAIRVWDRAAVRIVATPVRGTTIRIATTPTLVTVNGNAGGRIDDAEYEITLPRRMSVTVGSGDLAIDVKGCEGDVTAKNYSGTITVQQVKGTLVVKSVMGEVVLQNISGRVSAQSQNAPLRLTDIHGDVEAEGSANHIYLTRVDARTITASTVSGVIWFSGPMHDDGRYSLVTHSGAVFFTVAAPFNATLHVTTVSGAFSSTLPSTREDGPRRGRFTVKFGTGAANVDVETFNGGIIVRTPGSS